MFTREALALSWREIRPYFIFSAMLFFAGIIVGGTPGGSSAWIKDQLAGVADIARQAEASDHPQLSYFTLILVNNITKSLMTMYLGVAGAILPVFMLVVNGMVLGFLFGGLADQGENVWLLIAKGILPHGILEIPAFLLACGFGIRMGLTLLKGIFGSAIGKTDAWGAFRRTAAGSVPALILIAALMLVAAVIESTVTFWLAS